MSDHLEKSDVLEQAESDPTDESCSSDGPADTGPSASCQHGLYLGPGDDLSCGTHLTLPSTSSSGPQSLRVLFELAKQHPLTGSSTFVNDVGYHEAYAHNNSCHQTNASVMSSHEYYYPQVGSRLESY